MAYPYKAYTQTEKRYKMNAAKENSEEVLSFCGRCKSATKHTILSMIDEEMVDKCECKDCGGKHSFRDPVTKKLPKKKKSKTPQSPEKIWQDAVTKSSGRAVPYNMKAKFTEGQMIEHPIFGTGIVESIINDNKVKVVFELGAKTLVQNK